MPFAQLWDYSNGHQAEIDAALLKIAGKICGIIGNEFYFFANLSMLKPEEKRCSVEIINYSNLYLRQLL